MDRQIYYYPGLSGPSPFKVGERERERDRYRTLKEADFALLLDIQQEIIFASKFYYGKDFSLNGTS